MRVFVAVGAVFCLIGVISGALGAHAWKALLSDPHSLDNFNLAKDYMFYHGLGLIALGALAAQRPHKGLAFAGALFIFGSLLFQGSLYAASLSGMKSLTAVAPLGGLALMLGWLSFAAVALRMRK